MTTLAVDADEVGIHEQTLVADTQDTITFTVGRGTTRRQARVVNADGGGKIFFTVNGEDVDPENTKAAHWLPAIVGASKVVDLALDDEDPTAERQAVVKILSPAATTYSVEVG